MKITDINVHVMGIPGPDGKTPRRNWIFVEIQTDEGITGVGEATTEWHEQAVATHIESSLKPRLLGMDPTEIERIWQIGFRNFWWRRGVIHTSAMSGIDQALWDIAGKAAGMPVFKLLGGKVRKQIRCYARNDLGCGSVDQAVRQAVSEGFDAFKCGAGSRPWSPFDEQSWIESVAEELHLAREILGPAGDLMIDMQGSFSPETAHRLIERLKPLHMLFVEEPTAMDTIEPTLRLTRNFPGIRVAAGERWMTRWDCKAWFEQSAISVCQADVCHTGGISELMRIASLAEIYHITMAPHNPYGPVAMAANLHAAAAMPNFLILEHCRFRPWFERVQVNPLPIIRGHVDVDALAARPGLGVELDMSLVRSRPFEALAARRVTSADD